MIKGFSKEYVAKKSLVSEKIMMKKVTTNVSIKKDFSQKKQDWKNYAKGSTIKVALFFMVKGWWRNTTSPVNDSNGCDNTLHQLETFFRGWDQTLNFYLFISKNLGSFQTPKPTQNNLYIQFPYRSAKIHWILLKRCRYLCNQTEVSTENAVRCNNFISRDACA